MANVSLEEAKLLFGINFIGPDELDDQAEIMNIQHLGRLHGSIPEINFSIGQLNASKDTHILILVNPFDSEGAPVNLKAFRNIFGLDPTLSEPCFYNQDWYLNENFFIKCTIEYKWYLIRKELLNDSRALLPESQDLVHPSNFPSALLCAYTFFVYFFHSGITLWENDFVWCQDLDNNGDRIYVGRYFDKTGVAKNGFSIHRHLRIRENYGSIDIQY